MKISPEELANILRQSGYNNQKIALVACNAGKHTAPGLANELGVIVSGPTRKIQVNECGEFMYRPIKLPLLPKPKLKPCGPENLKWNACVPQKKMKQSYKKLDFWYSAD